MNSKKVDNIEKSPSQEGGTEGSSVGNNNNKNHHTEDSSMPPPSRKQVDRALSDCLFSQYGFTFASVSGATGYSLYKKHPQGIALMLVAGAAGSMADLVYGWNFPCQSQVQDWHNRNRLEYSSAAATKQNNNNNNNQG